MCGTAECFAPSELKMTSPQSEFIGGSFPLSLHYSGSSAVPAAAGGGENSSRHLDASLMLFGIIPIKNVSVDLTERKYVIPGGTPFGMRIYSDGLLVSSICTISAEDGEECPADDADVRQGDIIVSVDGKSIRTNEQLLEAVSSGGGETIKLALRRDGKKIIRNITPVYDSIVKDYRIGLRVRDSIAGIGTMTYIDPSNGSFAGLGHGICDSESGSLMPMLDGDIVPAEINSVTKSICGNPGYLSGHFSDSSPCGTLTANSSHGVYGTVCSVPENTELLPVAFKQEIVRGDAQIITTVDGCSPEYYDVCIEEISYNDRSSVKNMVIKVTDERLLRKTGGIVQGMSGSPIIQNGMIAGAVTHVFVNDPSRGYAVFAENMTPFSDRVRDDPVSEAS